MKKSLEFQISCLFSTQGPFHSLRRVQKGTAEQLEGVKNTLKAMKQNHGEKAKDAPNIERRYPTRLSVKKQTQESTSKWRIIMLQRQFNLWNWRCNREVTGPNSTRKRKRFSLRLTCLKCSMLPSPTGEWVRNPSLPPNGSLRIDLEPVFAEATGPEKQSEQIPSLSASQGRLLSLTVSL